MYYVFELEEKIIYSDPNLLIEKYKDEEYVKVLLEFNLMLAYQTSKNSISLSEKVYYYTAGWCFFLGKKIHC
jgi:hypothetical protein